MSLRSTPSTGRCSHRGRHSAGQSRRGWPARSSSLSISSSRGGFMRKRFAVIILAIASVMSGSGLVAAQTNERPDAIELFPVVSPPASPLFTASSLDTSLAQQPAGPPPTPRHTGIKAMTKHLVTNFKYLPSMENLYWAGAGGGLALAAHPFDDNVNHALVGNDTAEKIFKAGEILGELGPLLGSASVVYAVGRIGDRPKVPAYIFSSYVAISRLPANRHWLSDAVFGSAVGIIAGRTVTSHESERPFQVAVTAVPRGMAIMYVRQGR